MANINLSFNPKSEYDLIEAKGYIEVLLEKYHKSYNYSSSTPDSKSTAIDTNNSEEIEALKDKISSYEEQIETLKKEKSDLEDRIKTYIERKAELEKMYEELVDENNKIKSENSRLTASLKDYEKNTSSEDLVPYCIQDENGKILACSKFKDDPFVAKIDYQTGKAEFKFNSEETKRHSEFISNRDKLETFCEILNEVHIIYYFITRLTFALSVSTIFLFLSRYSPCPQSACSTK